MVKAKDNLSPLIDEVLKQLFWQIADARLKKCKEYGTEGKDLCTVYTRSHKGLPMRFVFCAERSMMKRIAEKMLEEPIEDQIELIEYMEEFSNIIFGHIAAAVIGGGKRPVRFYAPCFTEGSYMLENMKTEMIAHHYENEYGENASLLYDKLLAEIVEKEDGGEKIE